MLETLYTATPIEQTQIKQFLQEVFPGLKAFYCNFIAGESDAEAGFNAENPSHILFEVYTDDKKIEFGTQIAIYRTPNSDSEERSMFLAQKMSQKFDLKVLITYSHPEDQSPYYVLIFENGIQYLASDVDSNLADDGPELIKILREIELPTYHFDAMGHLEG